MIKEEQLFRSKSRHDHIEQLNEGVILNLYFAEKRVVLQAVMIFYE